MQCMYDLLGDLKDFAIFVSAIVTVVSFFVGWAVLAIGLFMSMKWAISYF